MQYINEPSWANALQPQFEQSYFKKLWQFVQSEYAKNTIYPPYEKIFNAFELTPLSSVKAVIIGQDPYHTPGAAQGLCFSVPSSQPIPPSLKNIYKAIKNDLGYEPPNHGCLENWAKNGVLMLNTVLTVQQNKANSHKNQGWETFTDGVIDVLNTQNRPIVFLLWGNPAQTKAKKIDNPKHLLLKAVHPSPLSAHRGFMDCGHFSKANQFLIENGIQPINWKIENI